MTDFRVFQTLENKIHSLNHKVRLREEKLVVLRKENRFLIRNSFRLLGKLYYTYLTTGTAGTNQLREIWRETCGNTCKMDRLVRFLDSHCEHLIRDLRSSVPGLGDDEVVLYCCFAVGFDAPLVSELTGVGVNTVYSRKKRMIDKILKLGPKRAQRFLDLLE